MPLRAEDPPAETDALRTLALKLAAENDVLKAVIKQINLKAAGQRSEHGSPVAEGQLDLELVDLAPAAEPPAAPEPPAPSAPRAKRTPARRNIGLLPTWLRRVIEVIGPEANTCAGRSGLLHRIDEDVAEALDVIPAQLPVLRTIRPRYACRACESGVVHAPARGRIFDGSMATTALVASVAVWKCAWQLPLNRQVQMLAGQGVRLDGVQPWASSADEIIPSPATAVGRETWVILASVLNTARLNDVDPFVWPKDVLEKIVSGQVKVDDLHRLLVRNWKAERAEQLAAA